MNDWRKTIDNGRAVIRVTIYGHAAGMPRPRARVIYPAGRKPTASFYSPERDEDGDLLPHVIWKNEIRAAMRLLVPWKPIENPVRLDYDVLFDRPAYLMTPWYLANAPGEFDAPKKPDRDNIDKAIMDVFTELKIWNDDAQVVAGNINKLYRSIAGRPCIRLVLTEREPIPGPPKRIKKTAQVETLFGR